MSSMPPAIVLFGPPLPGRSALARELARRLAGGHRFRAGNGHDGLPARRILAHIDDHGLPVIEGDFGQASDRRHARAALEEIGAAPLFVSWLCNRDEARQEIYRRYASQPARYSDGWWQVWSRDADAREAPGDEIPSGRLLELGTAMHLDEHVINIARALKHDVVLEPARPAGRRVLVVDDEEVGRTVLGAALEEMGCKVYLAPDADAALVIATGTPLDLVIADERMPGVSGSQLAAELHRRQPDLRVALLTGYPDETIDKALHNEGVAVLLAKPVRAADVIRLLDELH
jgi:CheY-like chemotaxis protein